MAAQSAYCPDCGVHRAHDALVVRQAIIAAFGLRGLERYEAQLRSGRIDRSRAARITITGRRTST